MAKRTSACILLLFVALIILLVLMVACFGYYQTIDLVTEKTHRTVSHKVSALAMKGKHVPALSRGFNYETVKHVQPTERSNLRPSVRRDEALVSKTWAPQHMPKGEHQREQQDLPTTRKSEIVRAKNPYVPVKTAPPLYHKMITKEVKTIPKSSTDATPSLLTTNDPATTTTDFPTGHAKSDTTPGQTETRGVITYINTEPITKSDNGDFSTGVPTTEAINPTAGDLAPVQTTKSAETRGYLNTTTTEPVTPSVTLLKTSPSSKLVEKTTQPVVVTVENKSCPDTWVLHVGKCYKVMLDYYHQNQIQANETCALHNASLVTVTNIQLQTLLENMTIKALQHQSQILLNKLTKNVGWGVWISAKAYEGSLVWSSQESNITFTDWAISRPDMHRIVKDNSCVLLNMAHLFKWRLVSCSQTRGAPACQID